MEEGPHGPSFKINQASILDLEILEELPLTRLVEADNDRVTARAGHFLADDSTDVIPILMIDRLADSKNAGRLIGCTLRWRQVKVCLRLFLEHSCEVDQHRVVALGAAYPEIFIPWLLAIDLLARLTFVAMLVLSFTDDLLARRAGAVAAEHEPGDILGPPSCPRLGRLRHSDQS